MPSEKMFNLTASGMTGLTRLLFIICALALTVAQAAPESIEPERIVFEQAELLISAETALPSPYADKNTWQTVMLPDNWGAERYGVSNNGWYRFSINRPPPDTLWAVYLPGLNMNAAAYFNGHLLGDGGSFDEPVGRNWSRPLYFTIPKGLWQANDNILMVRLKSYYGYGKLAGVVIGQDSTLKQEYKHQLFWETSFAQALFLLLLVISLFMFSIWYRRRRDSMYLWFSLTTLTWSILALNIFIAEIPVSEKIWDSFIYSSVAWWTVFLALFSYRFADINNSRLEILFYLYGAGATVTYVLSDVETFPKTTFFWQSGSAIIGFVVLLQLVLAWRKNRHTSVALLASGIALVQIAGVYNYLLQSNLIPFEHQVAGNILGRSSPIMLIVIAWHLTGRFVDSLNESEKLNLELESRVAEKSAELEKSHQMLFALEKRRAVNQERERIHRDLHDDVGAKLLSLTYRSVTEENAEIARSALQDLRSVVSRMSRSDLALTDALADWHAECSNRFEAAEIRLDWQQADELPNPLLVEQQIMNIGRILREAVSNTIRHARAEKVSVVLSHHNGKMIVVIEDDGDGFEAGRLGQGRGTRNMKLRAQQLGGELNWLSRAAGGCRVEWWFPLAFAESFPA